MGGVGGIRGLPAYCTPPFPFVLDSSPFEFLGRVGGVAEYSSAVVASETILLYVNSPRRPLATLTSCSAPWTISGRG